jgi:hypothetical protein
MVFSYLQSVQKIVVIVVNVKIVLGAASASERLAVADLLKIVQAAGDTLCCRSC